MCLERALPKPWVGGLIVVRSGLGCEPWAKAAADTRGLAGVAGRRPLGNDPMLARWVKSVPGGGPGSF